MTNISNPTNSAGQPISQPSVSLSQSIIKILISAGAAGVTYFAAMGYLNAAVAASIAAAIPNFAEAIVDNAVKYINTRK